MGDTAWTKGPITARTKKGFKIAHIAVLRWGKKIGTGRNFSKWMRLKVNNPKVFHYTLSNSDRNLYHENRIVFIETVPLQARKG
jgi:hypothetical protein